MTFRKVRWLLAPLLLVTVAAIILANINREVKVTKTVTNSTEKVIPAPNDASSTSIDDARRSAGNTLAVLASAFLLPDSEFRSRISEVATKKTAGQLQKLYDGSETNNGKIAPIGGDVMAKSLGYDSLADFDENGQLDYQPLQYKVLNFYAGRSAVIGIYGITSVITKKNQNYYQQDVPSIQIINMVWQDERWRYDKQVRPLAGEVPNFTESGQSFAQILAKYKVVLKKQKYKTYD